MERGHAHHDGCQARTAVREGSDGVGSGALAQRDREDSMPDSAVGAALHLWTPDCTPAVTLSALGEGLSGSRA